MTQLFDVPGFSRRVFLGTAAAAAGASLLPSGAIAAKTRYVRYNATGPQGQAMLESYRKGVEKLMGLDAGDPRNWFRNAFTHAMDCPHGNWWFFVWHRGFVGYFEQTVREASGNPDFAFPYWDWTQKPVMPDKMFDGVLDPTNAAYNAYSVNFDTFTVKMFPAMKKYWATLSGAQLHQLKLRGMPTLDSLWEQVKGNTQDGAMFVTTPYGRYLTRAKPELDEKTQKTVAWPKVKSGLEPTTFASSDPTQVCFNSIQTLNHQMPPSGSDVFSILEGNPHNKTHNNIGGVNYVDWQNYGWMADNLSPTDPSFFLHHSNMDRLWDVWTRKQQAMRLPYLPEGKQWDAYRTEPFLFYMDSKGQPVRDIAAGSYVNMSRFGYSYEPGMGEELVKPAVTVAAAAPKPRPAILGAMRGGTGAVSVPQELAGSNLVVHLTIARPVSGSAPREYDVLVNAPAGTTSVNADSPYYAGTVSFFGFMPGMNMGDVTFQVPLGELPAAAKGKTPGELVFTVVPSAPVRNLMATRNAAPSQLKAVTVTVQN
jgi:tyrosinase